MKLVRIGRSLYALVAVMVLMTVFTWSGAAAEGRGGAVFALTNAPNGNAVVMWPRAADGTLGAPTSYPTGGVGTGAGLGSQGALALSQNNKWLFAVDAGSNAIVTFRVGRDGLTQVGRVDSGGVRPTSLTIHKRVLYVLNAGDTGNITGFTIDTHGYLTAIPNSTRSLSGSATNPAQVQFSPDGDNLIVTEKGTNLIDVYTVDEGLVTGSVTFPSSGAVPFGFAFGKKDRLVVSEAGGGLNGLSAASSYKLDDDQVKLVTSSAPTYQGAACWVVITKNGRYAYTANAASGSISGFRIGKEGELTLLNADGRTGVTGDNSGPADMALSDDSDFLYVRNGRIGTIGAFAVQSDGSLQPLPSASGLPANSTGLIAY